MVLSLEIERRPGHNIDHETKNWIRNASDELAVKNGCRFDLERARFAVDWIEKYCRLYEGECAGQLIQLKDWQLEAALRLFGWVRYSDDWGRELRRFRRGSVWVPKKNKKSPTLAAFGLYLLCGDGELGQKVFSCAKDGKQAMIAHNHAIEMVRQSPELNDECRINKATGQITHEPTRSIYRVVAGDNINSQEGLNGSVLVDETHVVDRRLMSVLRGAGISRSEPLHLEFSTAGKDPDSYGKDQFEYAQRVISGETIDQEYFAMVYAADQEISDETLENSIDEVGKACNPAWGHTIKPEEFISHYRQAKNSMAELADFKTYRLNIWQNSASPWLKMSDWSACRDDFDEDFLAGRECYAGLDLSRTRDMSALSLIFPVDELFYLLTYFWMPENAARAKNHLVNFEDWYRQGVLTLTPGDVTDFGFIRGQFRQLAKKFVIKQLAYDKLYAEEMTQAMSDGVIDDNGEEVEEGTGVERIIFPQNITTFAGPTAEMERVVVAGLLRHRNNPVMNWQMGHVEVKTDFNNNKRPIKPSDKKDSVKKIDGVIASVMALGLAMQNAGTAYDSNNALVIL